MLFLPKEGSLRSSLLILFTCLELTFLKILNYCVLLLVLWVVLAQKILFLFSFYLSKSNESHKIYTVFFQLDQPKFFERVIDYSILYSFPASPMQLNKQLYQKNCTLFVDPLPQSFSSKWHLSFCIDEVLLLESLFHQEKCLNHNEPFKLSFYSVYYYSVFVTKQSKLQSKSQNYKETLINANKQDMQFLKPNKKYIDQQLKGNISNSFKFSIKDLYKTPKSQELQCCKNCSMILGCNFCIFCGQKTDQQIEEKICKNVTFKKPFAQGKKTVQSMILCIDISGSMNLTYRSKYKKINREFVERAIGKTNTQKLVKIIGQKELVKRFNFVQMMLQSGDSVSQIGYDLKAQLNNQMNSNEIQHEQPQYISRKQIIEIGINKYIESIKANRPQTQITCVYFNSNIEIPTKNFMDKDVIPGIEQKTVQEMIQLGKHYAKKISISSVKQIGDKLAQNMMKTEPDGQTALGPAIAFCLGLAKQFKSDLHQIVVVTDGLSNVGFAKTEQAKDLAEAKQIFKQLAVQHAVKNACVVNVIGFEDSAIAYDVIDEIIGKTNGLPYQISFTQEKQEKVVTEQTIQFFNFQILTSFSEISKQFCYDTKVGISVSNPHVKLVIPPQLERCIVKNGQQFVSLELGIRLVNENFEIGFSCEKQELEDMALKFTIINQYSKKSKVNYAIRQEFISIQKGDKQTAKKQQSQVLEKQLKDKLRFHKLVDENYNDYQNLEKKLQNKDVADNINPDILSKFNKKKKIIEQYEKTTDKLTKDKNTMQTRRNQTFKRRKNSSDQQDDGDAFL